MFRERILEVAFHRPAHRTRTVGRVIAFLDEEFLGRLVQFHPDVLVPDPPEYFVDFEVDDPDEVRLLEHVEDNEVVESVEEFRFEVPLGLLRDLVLHRGVVVGVRSDGTEAHDILLLDEFRPHVRGQNDDGVPEIDLAAEAVRDGAFFEDLKQKVHDIRMGLLDLVEKHHTVRTAPHGLAQLAAFLVAHVPRRTANEPARRELLHVFRHVDLDESIRVAKHEFSEIARQEGFTHTRRAEEQERANGTARILEIRPAAPQRLGDGHHGMILTNHLALQFLVHLQKLLGFFLLHAVERNSGPLADDGHDFIETHRDALFFIAGAPCFDE